jgi:hypothetical protein
MKLISAFVLGCLLLPVESLRFEKRVYEMEESEKHEIGIGR